MGALFGAIKQVVEQAIQGNLLAMGTGIVDIVASAIRIPVTLAEYLLKLLGYI